MNDQIRDIVWMAVDEVNAMATEGNIIVKEPNTPLLGADDGIDSLCFVNLVVALEDAVRRQKNKTVVIVNEETLASEDHPFRTIQTLTDYLEKLIDN